VRDYVAKETTAHELLKHEEDASPATYDHVLKASRDKTADNLKAYLADPVHVNNLKGFVEHNRTPIVFQTTGVELKLSCLSYTVK